MITDSKIEENLAAAEKGIDELRLSYERVKKAEEARGRSFSDLDQSDLDWATSVVDEHTDYGKLGAEDRAELRKRLYAAMLLLRKFKRFNEELFQVR